MKCSLRKVKKAIIYRIFDFYSQSSKAVYSLQEIVHLNTIFTESVKY